LGRRLLENGDGIDGNIAEYCELLFDLDTGCWKEEVQDEYEAASTMS